MGLIAPIFEKLDPITIGEDYRSNRLAQSYAERLNVTAKNLIRRPDFDALEMLLSGYNSHGFVIDRKEASNLFSHVKPISAQLISVTSLLGADALFPRNRRQGQGPKLEFLNDEKSSPAEVPESVLDAPDATDHGSTEEDNRSGELPGNSEERTGAETSR